MAFTVCCLYIGINKFYACIIDYKVWVYQQAFHIKAVALLKALRIIGYTNASVTVVIVYKVNTQSNRVNSIWVFFHAHNPFRHKERIAKEQDKAPPCYMICSTYLALVIRAHKVLKIS